MKLELSSVSTLEYVRVLGTALTVRNTWIGSLKYTCIHAIRRSVDTIRWVKIKRTLKSFESFEMQKRCWPPCCNSKYRPLSLAMID